MSNGGLTVAVTGPTGEIGKPFVRALERTEEVGRIVAMARRPFNPRALGWRKTEYHRGDIVDRAAVDRIVAGADVVAHLAFVVAEATARSRDVNVDGSRNVFAASADACVPRLVYTSSVAAYGYPESDAPITEDMPAAGTERHAYSRHKAEAERILFEALAGTATVAYVFRPCIVAGPDATALLDRIPYVRMARRMPELFTGALARIPLLRPLLPDHGVPFQLVHHDDVADALVAAVLGRGEPGVYNVAGDGSITISDLAAALGWHAVPVSTAAVEVTAKLLARIPPLAATAGWLEAARRPVLMDTSRARTELGWHPRFDSRATLEDLVASRRR